MRRATIHPSNGDSTFRFDNRLPAYRARVKDLRRIYAAVLWLTEHSPARRRELYQENRYKGLLLELERRKGQCVPGPIHGLISELAGRRDTIRLYTGSVTDGPEYAVQLRRGADGLWYTTVKTASAVSKRPKPGILFHIHPDKPDAFEKLPMLTHVVGAGREVVDTMKLLLDDWEARRMISHVYIVQALLKSRYTSDTLAIDGATGGRLLVHVDPMSSDGWVMPYDIVPLREVPDSNAPDKKRVRAMLVHEELPGLNGPHMILPVVRDNLKLGQMHVPNNPKLTLQLHNACRPLVRAGVIPYLRIIQDNGTLLEGQSTSKWCDIVVASYTAYGEYGDPELECVLADRARYMRMTMPSVVVDREGDTLRCNRYMFQVFRNILSIKPHPSLYMHHARLDAIASLTFYMYHAISRKDVEELFLEHGIVLGEESRASMDIAWPT